MKATIVRADWEADHAWLRVSWSELREVSTGTIGDVIDLPLHGACQTHRMWTCPDCGENMLVGPDGHHDCNLSRIPSNGDLYE